MKCTVAKKDLLKLLDRCKVAIDNKIESATAQAVLFTADGENLSAFATNLQISMYTECQCAVESAGRAVVHLEKLRNAVRAMPDGMIHLQTDPAKHSTSIKCSGHRRYTIHGLNPDHFPERNVPDAKLDQYTLDSKLCNEAINRIKASMAPNEVGLQHRAGVLMEFLPTTFNAVAISNYTISVFEKTGEFKNEQGAVFVPSTILSSITSNSEDTVSFSYSDRTVFVRMGVDRLSALLPHAAFPDWRFFQKNGPAGKMCQVDVEQLIDAVRSVTAITKGTVELRMKKSVLGIKLVNVPDAEGEDSLPVTAEDDISFDVRTNPDYLLNILEGAGGGIATLFYDPQDAKSALSLQGDDGFWGLMQPVER